MADPKIPLRQDSAQRADVALATVPDEPYYQQPNQARRSGVVLLVIGLIWLVFELTTRGSLLGGGLGFVEQSAVVAPQEFNGEALVVNVGADEVELTRWDGDTIRVEATKYGFGWNGGIADQQLEQLDLAIEQRGETVQVEVLRPSGWALIGRTPYVELRIAVPEGIDLSVNTISGDLSAEGVSGDGALATVSGGLNVSGLQGDLRLRSTSGDITVEDYRGVLDAESVSGNINVDTADTELLRASTVSGDIELDDVSGELAVTSISGNIDLAEAQNVKLQLNTTSGDIDMNGDLLGASSNRIESVSGNVDLTLNTVENLRLTMTTLSGELTTDLALENEVRERRELSGQIGDGSTTLTISTTSGDATVN